jgi:putative membrane protein
MKRSTIRTMLLLPLVLAACARTGNGAASEAGDTMGMTPPPPASADTLGALDTVGQGVMRADTMRLTDAQIAAVLSASDSAEIKPSQIALQKARNAQLREFAQRMVTDHGMLEDSLRSMLRTSQLTPAPSPLSMQVQADAARTVGELDGLSGAAFDQAYARAMVQSHEQALATIDNQLLPDVQNPQLRAALNHTIRPTVQAHLASIRSIRAAMGGQ